MSDLIKVHRIKYETIDTSLGEHGGTSETTVSPGDHALIRSSSVVYVESCPISLMCSTDDKVQRYLGPIVNDRNGTKVCVVLGERLIDIPCYESIEEVEAMLIAK